MKSDTANDGQGPPSKPMAAGRSDRQFMAARRATPSSPITRTGKGTFEIQLTTSLDELLADLSTPTGVSHDDVAIRVIEQVANSIQRGGAKHMDALLIEAINRIAEMAPRGLTEAMLATQIIATHEAALMFLRRATADGQTFEGADANVTRASRLMRLHLDQIEAMQKLKGKAGQQKVTVEHVHVYQGGQAIVGTVNPVKNEPGEGGE